MNLLIINFVMDPQSQVLAWQTKVAFALGLKFEKVFVVTHEKKNLANVPGNIKIIVFPNIFLRAPMRWGGGKYLLNFWIYYLHLKYRFDKAFIHMNFEWAYFFSPFFKITGIPLSIWYAHGSVSPRLYKAHKIATRVVSSTKEGFRIPSDKLVLIGQSIDTEIFPLMHLKEISGVFIYVGRISPRKNIDKLIEVVDSVVKANRIKNCKLMVVGGPLTDDDRKYEAELFSRITALGLNDHIEFTGPLSQLQIAEMYKTVFAHMSFSETGSMDKTLMESLSCGCPVLTSNDAVINLLEERYRITKEDITGAVDRLCYIHQHQAEIDRFQLRQIVINKHDFSSYIEKLSYNIAR
ncbi:MAG: glycosyltransferase family 4 protein [Ferruginibacter sp.]